MVEYFYKLQYDIPGGTKDFEKMDYAEMSTPTLGTIHSKVVPAECPELMVHTKVYALAEKYMIEGLKMLALEKFTTAATQYWESSTFLEAAREAYTSTIELERGLRDAILEVFYNHPTLLDDLKVQLMLQEVPQLGFDLLMNMRKHEREKSMFGFGRG